MVRVDLDPPIKKPFFDKNNDFFVYLAARPNLSVFICTVGDRLVFIA